MYTKRYVLPLMLVLASTMPLSLLANILVPHLVPPEDKGYREPSDRISIAFPFDILDNITTQLALEIDSIDVSSLVVIEGNRVIYVPPSPLIPGMHQLRLVEYAANGDIVELGNWRFEIRQSAAFQEQQAHLAASFNNSYLIADDYSSENPDIDNYHSNGAVDVVYSARNNNSAVQFQGNLIYEKNSASGKEADLGQYLLSVDMGEYAHFNVGHHSIQYSSLIYRDFNRRGVSGRFSLPGINSMVQLFSARTGDLSGFSEGLGVGDADDRVSGAVLNYQPFSDNPNALTISTSYMTGARKSGDASLGLFVEESSGDARSIALDSYLADQRVRLYLEAAQSNFDFDGNAASLEAQQDNAYQFVTQYTSKPIGTGTTPWQWGVSIEKTFVEPDFYSLSNRNLVGDSDFTMLSTSLSKGSWFSQLFMKTEQDNVDNRFDSTNKTSMVGLDVTYSEVSNSENTFLGSPVYKVTYQQTQQKQDGVELDVLMVPLLSNDNQAKFIELSSEFSYQWGSWYLRVNYNAFEDDANIQPDSQTKGAEWGGSFSVSEKHRLTTSISHYDTEEHDSQLDNEVLTYSMAIVSSFKSMALNSSFTLDYEQIDDALTQFELIKKEQLSISATLAKQFARPKGLVPGADLQLRASYFDLNNHSIFDEDTQFYEIFVDLNLYWDSRRPQGKVNN